MAIEERESPPAQLSWIEKVEDRWKKTREHAETYPYVWGSYILVYGGLGVYISWRWRKLRQTEQRVRILQEQLRKLVEAEEAAAISNSSQISSSSAPKPSPSDDDPSSRR